MKTKVGGEQPSAGFEWRIRVYYEDTDAGAIVFFANYLKFFERARTEWLRHLGYDQREVARQKGLIFVVKHTCVDYLKPAYLDDTLRIVSRITRMHACGVEFEQDAWRDETLLARGTIAIVCVNSEKMRPSRIPALLASQLAASAGHA